MPHIRELLDASVLVIVRYHREKLPTNPGTAYEALRDLLERPPTEYEMLRNILGKPQAEMISDLSSLIDAAIAANTRDEARRSLLVYLQDNINQLRTFIDSPNPFEEEPLGLIKQNLIQFIVTIQQLLPLSKIYEKTITYNQKEIKLYGLGGAFWGVSISGRILSEILFPKLLLTINSDLGEITTIIKDMVDEHQRNLISQAAQATEVVALRHEIATREEPDTQEPSMLTEDEEVDSLKTKLLAVQLELQNVQEQQRLQAAMARRQMPKPPPTLYQATKRTAAIWANFFLEPEPVNIAPNPRGDENEDDATASPRPITKQPNFDASGFY